MKKSVMFFRAVVVAIALVIDIYTIGYFSQPTHLSGDKLLLSLSSGRQRFYLSDKATLAASSSAYFEIVSEKTGERALQATKQPLPSEEFRAESQLTEGYWKANLDEGVSCLISAETPLKITLFPTASARIVISIIIIVFSVLGGWLCIRSYENRDSRQIGSKLE